jgi:hypothetical protein
MKWTEILAGVFKAAVDRLFPALGEDAGDVVAMINADPASVKAIAEHAIALSREWVKAQTVRIIEAGRVMEVNLDATPTLPFDGAVVVEHKGGGWIRVEKRADGLYVAGKKVILYLSERQRNGKVVKGHELREELSGKPVLNSNLLDALFDHPEFISEDWKKDEKGNTIYTFFWATIFRDADGSLCVRYLCWNGGGWNRNYRWLGPVWLQDFPSALLE